MIQRGARIWLHCLHVQSFQVLAQIAANWIRTADFTVQFNILRDGKAREQHELLVYHADALFHGIVGGKDARLLTV